MCIRAGDPNEIIVRRAKLLATAFSAIKPKTFDCCKDVIVQFSGEDATDAGGPRREFFRYRHSTCDRVKLLKVISYLPFSDIC